MLTQMLADSATDAAWAGAIGQWAGAIATLAAVVVALWLPVIARKRADAERRAQLAGEVMASMLDLKTALEVIRMRSSGAQTRWPMLLAIFTDLFAEGRPSNERKAAALYRAIDLNRSANDFAYTAMSGPLARSYTALSQISLCGNEDLRLAAHEVRRAMGELLTGFGEKRKWNKTSRELDKSVAEFRSVTVRVTKAAKR